MKGFRLLAALSLLISGSEALSSQERDAFVLAPGQARLTVGASYLWADARLSDAAGLAAGLDGRLTADRFRSLVPLQEGLSAFFEATANVPSASPVDPADLTAGDLSLDLAGNYRVVPITFGVGLLPGVELSATIPVYRSERLIRRVTLEGANVGINPYTTELRAQLEEIAPGGAAIGSSVLVPTAGSPLGRELQERVIALTGRALALPGAPVGTAGKFLPQLPTRYSIGEWQPGDLEVEARLELSRSFQAGLFPDRGSEGINHRLTLLAAARFPTGRETALADGIGLKPDVGGIGAGGGAIADVFLRELWVSAGAQIRTLGLKELMIVVPDDPQAAITGSGTRSYSTDAEVWLTPRFRIEDEVAVAVTLASELWLGGRGALTGVDLDDSTATRHSIGGSLRFSDIQPPQESRRIAIEANAGFRTSVFGSGGAPDTNVVFVQLSLMRRVWGGR